jgi:hypothetical protein
LGPAGLIAAAFAAGVAIGMFVDKLFGISDKLGDYFSKQKWFQKLVGAEINEEEALASNQSGSQAKAERRRLGLGGYKEGEATVTPIKAYALGGQVEETGLAYLHQGETVVPSSSSKDFSDGTTKEMLTVLKDIRYSGVSQIDFLRRQIDELRGLKNQSIDSILQLEVA